MITVGDIFIKQKIELFSSSENSRFFNTCKAREKQIKEAIRITFRSINIHLQEFEKNRAVLAKWKKEWITSCITNLHDYLEYLLNELDRKKIETYCKLEEIMGDRFVPFIPDLVLLMINSYQGAVETDLHWIPDLKMIDSIAISNGDFDFTRLQEYLPARINEIEVLYKELDHVFYVKSHSTSIHEAILCFQSKHEKAGNLLLLTIIEGLVRSLGIFLKEKQKLTADPTDKRKYASLDSFLKKIQWKKDLRISDLKFGLLTGNYPTYKETNAATISVSLTERLGFLCRRFKENRNIILHGEETNYATPLNSFLNFSALKEVLLTIKEYQVIYK